MHCSYLSSLSELLGCGAVACHSAAQQPETAIRCRRGRRRDSRTAAVTAPPASLLSGLRILAQVHNGDEGSSHK